MNIVYISFLKRGVKEGVNANITRIVVRAPLGLQYGDKPPFYELNAPLHVA